MSEITDLKDQVADLRLEIERLNTRLNVALELLAECRFSGYPENTGIVAERLERAERREVAVSADADDVTAGHAIPPPRASSLDDLDDVAEPPDVATPRAKYEPFVPGEAPLAQQQHHYDHQTNRDRQMNKAIDMLDGLGKRK
jgi:hypothetical protein